MPVATADGGCSRRKKRIDFVHLYVSVEVFNTSNHRNQGSYQHAVALSQCASLASVSFSQLPRRGGADLGGLLSHMNNRAASLKANFVHQHLHQVESAPMGELHISWGSRIRDRAVVKSSPLIADGD